MPANEIVEFHRFLGSRLSSGVEYAPVEDALDEWRMIHSPISDSMDATPELLDAISDLEAGDTGMTLEEFDRHLRQKHSFLRPS